MSYSYLLKLIHLSAWLTLSTVAYTATRAKAPLPQGQEKALRVLQTKCNVCHEKQNPRKVFTKDNMRALAPKIYQQVYVKGRMPKKGGERLTADEYNDLKNWLLTQEIF